MHRIFFVDDSSTEQMFFKLLVRIKKLPLEVETFFNPMSALEALEAKSKEEWPDAIISDIKMPLMDGFQFADAFQDKYFSQNPSMLFFLCSSSIRSQDTERADSHPAISCYLEKPLNEDKINGQIISRLKQKTF
ncbi:response regulator [Flavilitoribacter nigricans]|uniref:Response regulator n=1 Tax=Flavilitoribacter nigricans (strain ATCC 23147 / DSM 23189 / NBRC 102662 / NCIMB 1420 / SS-2) TaxID=1122177 RepID=A0A2D0NHF9_FLAN2|nr:response regulator [Flavilitoribacter nigricans]PHN07925.1 response regulator [Flavilitoribacter nigricans DSM 23189 = NBRC 102662]